MKCLTVRQPWAQLISDGHKTIEIRSWLTKYRGPLLITASSRKNPDNLPIGCTICLVDLVDCRLVASDADADAALCNCSYDDYAWVLSNPRPIKNVPVKGKLSIWEPSTEMLHELGMSA